MNNSNCVLSIIIVNWNGGGVVLECLASIYQYPPSVPHEVIIWDNASTDGSDQLIDEIYPMVKLVRGKENIGFAGGNNAACKLAKGQYFLLLNNDTLIQKGTIDKVINYAIGEPEVGIWGCKILNIDGSLQYSAGRFPNFLSEFLDQTMLYEIVPYSKYISDDYNQVFEPDWVTGAFMLLRREVYERIGGFDEYFYMFFEDVDYCYRAKNDGWKVKFLPSATVVHRKGYSSNPIIGEMIIEDQRSTYRYIRKYYPGWHLFVFRLLASLGSVLRYIYWMIQGIIGKHIVGKRQEVKIRMDAYKQVLIRTWFDREFCFEDEIK